MKTLKLFPAVLLLSLLFAYNCTASKNTTAATTDVEVETDIIEELDYTEESLNTLENMIPRFGETPEDSIQCIRNLSLYQEFYNQGNRQMAYEPWREVFFNCPQASQNTFIRGATLVKMQYAQETDPLRRDAWVDTLMMVYDKRIEYFGTVSQSREGYVLGRKAVDLFQLRPNNTMEIYELTKKSIELEGDASQADVLLIHMQSLIRLVEAGISDQGEILNTYEKVMSIVEYNLENNPGDKRFFEPAKTNIDMMFEPYATCENIITLFTPRYEQNPGDIELLEKITSMLNKSGCTDSELYYKTTLSLHQLKPSAESAYLMGRMESSAQNFPEALQYFQQAVNLYEDDEEKFTALLLMAEISFRQLRQYSQARTYALQASELDPDNGRPFLLIGEMYATTASQCGDNDLTKSVAYWAAVDKFITARNVDSDEAVIERANQLINTYSQYFPNNELIFFHGLTEGNSYRVDCWINETTRVRAR